MKKFIVLFALIIFSCSTPKEENISLVGLSEPVEIIRDQWGINHIYAQNQEDLFFAQGYAAAKDRLFQFEIWRRQATGTIAEILGDRELKRDIGTRLFKYRGDLKQELNHYHPEGELIINAYTAGVNAYIDEILAHPEELPIEFEILNIVPERWTPEVVISRHQGLLGNIEDELQIGRAVATIGTDAVKDIMWFHPKDPDLQLDPSIHADQLSADILELYTAYRKVVKFDFTDVDPAFQQKLLTQNPNQELEIPEDKHALGSNNWVVSGTKMADGNTYMANDPHLTIAVPSLRYMVHLNAPGWDVIGGGEPEIPGISIGHNQYGAWGLTVFETDGEDLYVYDINPDNLKQYWHQNQWVTMETIAEIIKVKNEPDVLTELNYTLHGPVTYIDTIRLKAYAVKCAWLEPGGSPYLASLRMDQAKTWEEFQAACNYSHIPGENMIWADKKGNIGWQAVGIAPIRNNFSGLVPVPGDGRFEWDGYLPIIEKPNALNPSKGFIATANQNVIPEDYDHWNAVGYTWSDPFRGNRLHEVLDNGQNLTLENLRDLQVDDYSIPARTLVPLLLNLKLSMSAAEALAKLSNWNYRLEANSIEAAIYVAFENELAKMAHSRFVPEKIKNQIRRLSLTKIILWLMNPDPEKFGSDPTTGRNQFLGEAFENGIVYLTENLGSDMNTWQYGQPKFKHTFMEHALSQYVDDVTQAKLNLGPLPRGGNAYTPGSTGSNNRQSSGASFRMIINTGDWDAAIATNGPGQSGNPESPYYRNLFESWANNEYFPVYYEHTKIESVSAEKIKLVPKK